MKKIALSLLAFAAALSLSAQEMKLPEGFIPAKLDKTYVEAQGFSLVRDFVGHGVGANLHEDPEVPNFGRPGHGVRLQPGMTLAIEPMVNVGVYEVNVMSDGWTVKTKDGKLSAHYENSVAITEGDPVILTLPEDGENW